MTTAHMATATIDSTAHQTIVPETRGPGRLTSIGIAGGRQYHYFKVTIDDVEVFDSFFSGSNTRAADSNVGIALDFPFTKKLKVEGRDSKRSAITNYLVAYVTDNSPLIGEPHLEVVTSDEGREYLRRISRFSGQAGEYQTEELVGPRYRTVVLLNSQVIPAGEPVSGQVRLFDQLSREVSIISGVPIAVTVRDYDEVVASTDVTDGAFTLELDQRFVRLPLEISTVSDIYANIPLPFTIV